VKRLEGEGADVLEATVHPYEAAAGCTAAGRAAGVAPG
jgi:hypothetical protein